MSDSPDFVLAIINKYWRKGQKILEVGCGPAFLRKHYKDDYIGADITDSAYSKDYPRDVDIVCPADRLNLADNSVDIVVIKSAFFLFPDHKQSLSEAVRVLKPNGTLLLFDYNCRTQKILQNKEGHSSYPCWTQWSLRKMLSKTGLFSELKNYIASTFQPVGIKKLYHLLRQELRGTWVIIAATKSNVKATV